MAFKMKGFPMISGTKPMKMAVQSAKKMKAAMKLKEEAAMKAAKPDFPDIDGDGNTTESMKQAAKDKKSPKELKESAMKLKSAMKDDDVDAEVAKGRNERARKLKGAGYKGSMEDFASLSSDQQVSLQKLGSDALSKGYNSTYINKMRNQILNPKTERKTGDDTPNMMKSSMKLKDAAMKMGHSPKKKAVSYKEAYKKADKSKYKTFAEFEKAAKDYNIKKYGTTEPTRDAKKAGISKDQLAKNKAKASTTSKPEAKTEKSFKPVSKVDKKRKNKTVTTTNTIDVGKGTETKKVVKEKKNKTKTTTTSGKNLGLINKDKKQKPETKITSKVKKDKEGNVRKEKDTVVSGGNVSKTTTKYDKKGNVKSSKVKNRKQFSETKFGKFLSGKTKK